METLLAIFGAKWCCVFASTMGGLTNGLVHTWLGWIKEAKNLAIAAIVGWIAAEFFIPALMEQFGFGVYTALAIAFFIGYSGIRCTCMTDSNSSCRTKLCNILSVIIYQ